MSNGDVWGATSVTVQRSSEGVEELVRCGSCTKPFRRAKESGHTHRDVDDTVDCPPDAEVTGMTPSTRWSRR